MDDLRRRGAAREPVQRAAKDGDELTIDFKGRDAKTDEAISGADGSDYPLVLGSNSFIPGFEAKLVGSKPDSEAEFTLTFPKDYGVADLQNRKVTFSVKVHKFQAVILPKADDAFAATIGPFKAWPNSSLISRNSWLPSGSGTDQRAYESKLLQLLTEKSDIVIQKFWLKKKLTAWKTKRSVISPIAVKPGRNISTKRA